MTVLGKRSLSDCSRRPGSSDKIDAAHTSSPLSRLGCNRRREILTAYEEVLELHSSSMRDSSSLPYPKKVIREAILEELTETIETMERTHLELYYAQLEVFLIPREYTLVEKFNRIKALTERMVRSGNPLDLIAAGELIKGFPGDKVVGIFERVSKQMHVRLAEVRRLVLRATAS